MSLVRRIALSIAVVAHLSACGDAPSPPRAPTAPSGGAPGQGEAGSSASAPASSEDDAAVPVAADDAVRGSRFAYVTIVVFSDFECPACSAFRAPLEKVRAAHGPEDVRVVFKNYPLPQHPHARIAAEVGQGVLALRGPEAFWRYHDRVFDGQQAMSDARVVAWAREAGADEAKIREGLSRKTWAAKIDKDRETGTRLGILGTPAIFVNGIALEDLDDELLEEVVKDQLDKARSLNERGVARDKIYTRLSTANFRERPTEPEEPEEPPVDATVWKVPVGKSPVRGSPTALVTVVLFSDFQCPFCKRVEPTLERLRAEYKDKIRVVWKDQPLPFHPQARPAAILARAARAQKGDAAFWDVHARLFAASPNLDEVELTSIARAAGVDAKKAMSPASTKLHDKGIEADVALAEDVLATGTPHFFVNGRRLMGAQPYEKIKALVDEELAKAEAKVSAGTPPASLYETLIKDGKTAPPPERKSVAPAAGPAPFRGAANAKVVVQEFSDFQCPFCKRADATMDELLKAYPGKIKIVFRNLPLVFHADAPLAAEAAREAFVQKGNAGFSKYREKLFEHQADPGGLKRPALESYARGLGLDMKKFDKALDEHVHKPAIDADKKAAEDAGIKGTPGYVVGPFFVSGAQPLNKFKRAVDLALAEKQARP
jgi:protein-disulfide isomerase